MSTTIIAVIVQLLSLGLPKLGITVGSEELTGTLQTIVLIGSGLWIWYRRTQKGDVSGLGVRK